MTDSTMVEVKQSTTESGREEATRRLLSAAEENHTKPLWTQMAKLNPPLPNPKTVPHVWEYKRIRPQLLQAGELVTEKQAERRVLMLTNPARGRIREVPVTRSMLTI